MATSKTKTEIKPRCNGCGELLRGRTGDYCNAQCRKDAAEQATYCDALIAEQRRQEQIARMLQRLTRDGQTYYRDLLKRWQDAELVVRAAKETGDSKSKLGRLTRKADTLHNMVVAVEHVLS